jgi:hypothetical protein
MSVALNSPVVAIALAAKGPPLAVSHVVMSMYKVRRPAWLTLPSMTRPMNSDVPNGRRSRLATESGRPLDDPRRLLIAPDSPGRREGSTDSWAHLGNEWTWRPALQLLSPAPLGLSNT